MAREGATVFVSDILLDQARQVSDEINSSGGSAIELELDVTSELSWQQAIDTIISSSGNSMYWSTMRACC